MEQQSESICHDHLATLFQLWMVNFILAHTAARDGDSRLGLLG